MGENIDQPTVFGAPLVSEAQIRGVAYMLDRLIGLQEQARDGMGGDSELLRSAQEQARQWLAEVRTALGLDS